MLTTRGLSFKFADLESKRVLLQAETTTDSEHIFFDGSRLYKAFANNSNNAVCWEASILRFGYLFEMFLYQLKVDLTC